MRLLTRFGSMFERRLAPFVDHAFHAGDHFRKLDAFRQFQVEPVHEPSVGRKRLRCPVQHRSTVYPMPGMMSTCLPVSVFFTRFLPHGVTAGVTFFVVGCVPFLPMLCLIRLFVCSVRLGRSLWPASFPILHARRRQLQSFPSVHHALVAELRTDLLRRFRARSGRQQHRGHARLSVRQLNSDKTRSRHT